MWHVGSSGATPVAIERNYLDSSQKTGHAKSCRYRFSFRVLTVVSLHSSCSAFPFSLSVDGMFTQVVDGAVSAQWLAAFRGLVENPLTMLL